MSAEIPPPQRKKPPALHDISKIWSDSKLSKLSLGVSARIVRDAERIVDSAGRNAARWGNWSDLEKVTVSGREYAPVNNRLFTQHAVEHMAPRGLGSAAGQNPVLGRGVPPSVVEDVITNGQLVNEAVAGSGAMRQTWLRDGVQVITEQAGRTVVTVMRVGGQ